MGLIEKLSGIQKEMKVPKNLYNKFGDYNYRNAESIFEAFKPLEAKYKVSLVVSDDVVHVGDRIYIKATAKLIDCESQDFIAATAFAREAPGRKGMDDAQVTGSASSYARKYALNGLFLLDDTKDPDTNESQAEKNNRCQAGAEGGSPGTGKSQIDSLRGQLTEECRRTGKGKTFLKERYAVESPEFLSESQLADAIEALKKLPDRRAS